MFLKHWAPAFAGATEGRKNLENQNWVPAFAGTTAAGALDARNDCKGDSRTFMRSLRPAKAVLAMTESVLPRNAVVSGLLLAICSICCEFLF